MIETTDDPDEARYVVTLKGLLVLCLKKYLPEMDSLDLIAVADEICQQAYDYACKLAEPNQVPAIVFVSGHQGDFEAIEVGDGEDEEVM